MLIPIGDSPNLPRTPWVTWMLIVLNVAIHLTLWPLSDLSADRSDPATREYLAAIEAETGSMPPKLSRGEVVRYQYGFRPAAPSGLDAFTAMFLHGGFLHLFGNMLFLWIFGDNVEHRFGRLGFLVVYLATGFAGAAGDWVLRAGSQIPAVGASGAISGVLGLYFVFFPRNTVRMLFLFFPIFLKVFEWPARWVLGAYLVFANLLPALLGAGSGVSYGAHIGGFAAGWAVAKVADGRLARPVLPERPQEAARPAGSTLHERFRQALWMGDLPAAASYLFDPPRAITRQALSAADKVALGDALASRARSIDEWRLALGAFQRALADHPTAPERAAAHLGAAQVLLHGLGTPTGAYQHLYDVLEGATPDSLEYRQARQLFEDLKAGVLTVPRRR